MQRKHRFFRLSLVNLAIVALLGLTLRLKIVFEIPFIDYHNLLSAHSHFAFAGWVSLLLLTLLVQHLLPPAVAAQRAYGRLLTAVNGSAFGMLLSFPFQGYGPVSIFFSTAFIVVTYVFAARYLPALKGVVGRNTRLLAGAALLALLLSAAGPILLGYIKATHSGNSLLYRDAIYGFLHFQYNGFFTLALFAHFFHRRFGTGPVPRAARIFSYALAGSVVPTLFLALFWHNLPLFYTIGAMGVLLLLTALVTFLRMWRQQALLLPFRNVLARRLLRLSFLSFCLKLLLQAGTLLPRLANAVYGDRPIIIGFLHLVLLGFISLYLLAVLVEEGYFSEAPMHSFPVYLFVTGVFVNEALLMLQGLSILMGSNSAFFSRGLLGAAALLFSGAALMAVSAWRQRKMWSA